MLSVSTELVAAYSWTAERRRVSAVKACDERDGDALIGLMNAYLSAKGKRGSATSAATRKTYETGLLRWILFCWPEGQTSPNVRLLKATVDDVERFRAERLQGGNAPATVGAYLAAVRTLYRALLWAGAIQASPAEEVRSPSDPRPQWERNSPVPRDDYKKLLKNAAERGGSLGQRDAALLRLLGDVGLRIAEACDLNVSDIDLERRLLIVQHGKGDKRGTVGLTKAAVDALAAWKRRRLLHVGRGEQAFLINVGRYCAKTVRGRRMNPKSAARYLNGLYAEAGVPTQVSGAHALRHTAGTRIYEATNGDIVAVQRQLRHSNINTSSAYSHYSLERLMKTMDSLDGDLED